jgi:hypothetical protein
MCGELWRKDIGKYKHKRFWRIPPTGMWCHVALIGTAVLKEYIASIIRVASISELGTMLAVFLCSTLQLLVTANIVPSSPILVTLMIEVIRSSETLVLTRGTQCHIPKDGILHSHCRENLISYIRDFDGSSSVFSILHACTPWNISSCTDQSLSYCACPSSVSRLCAYSIPEL